MHMFTFFPQTIHMMCAFSTLFYYSKNKKIRKSIYKANCVSKIAYTRVFLRKAEKSCFSGDQRF